MPRIRWVEEEEATGELAEIYRAYVEKTGRPRVAGILKCFSPRPDFLQDVMQFSQHIHFSFVWRVRCPSETWMCCGHCITSWRKSGRVLKHLRMPATPRLPVCSMYVLYISACVA